MKTNKNIYIEFDLFVIFQMSVIGATRRRHVPLDRAALETDQGAALGAGGGHGRNHSPAGIYFFVELELSGRLSFFVAEENGVKSNNLSWYHLHPRRRHCSCTLLGAILVKLDTIVIKIYHAMAPSNVI